MYYLSLNICDWSLENWVNKALLPWPSTDVLSGNEICLQYWTGPSAPDVSSKKPMDTLIFQSKLLTKNYEVKRVSPKLNMVQIKFNNSQ